MVLKIFEQFLNFYLFQLVNVLKIECSVEQSQEGVDKLELKY